MHRREGLPASVICNPSSEAEVNLPLDVQDVLEESMLRGQSEKREEATGWPGECWPTVLSLETGVW